MLGGMIIREILPPASSCELSWPDERPIRLLELLMFIVREGVRFDVEVNELGKSQLPREGTRRFAMCVKLV